MRKIMTALLAGLGLTVLTVGGAFADEAITVTDMTGREVVLEEPAERVVALTAADCEILYALGAGDLLVGRGEYCDYPAEVFDVPSVESGYETNVEEIIALEPQVLLMGTMAQSTDVVDQLEKAGIRVVVSDAQNIEGTYEAIRM
ncbi:MAG: ABC transporter substrate-binding protein, partial [Lachnospiraceae bacterium]|nr:ABC transporter substrate-binding protein [Lachnospiraceae bacterium]